MKIFEEKIPTKIFDDYQNKKEGVKSCLNGIWKEIHHIYFIIDNIIYLWNYYQQTPLMIFTLGRNPIYACALTSTLLPRQKDTKRKLQLRLMGCHRIVTIFILFACFIVNNNK